MSNIPEPFHIDLPSEVPAPRREQYEMCPECGEQSFDADPVIRACMNCDYAEPFVPERESTPEEVAAFMADVRARMALRAALPPVCECCEQAPPAVEATYPIYCDYSGKLIAAPTSLLCVPCLTWRQSPFALEAYGLPTSVKYI